MPGILRKSLAAVVAAALFVSAASAGTGASRSVEAPVEDVKLARQGRIVVLVVDISQSIEGQIDEIVDGLCNEIVDKKLESGDYCVVVPLGDGRNSDRADSFGVRFSTDKDKIKSYLRSIKSWMKTNLDTDIGAAMRKTFDYINLINSENTGEMYAPQVIFITDGEIFHSRNSPDPLRYESPDAIFKDPAMDPERNSYDNWWFLGIENEGVPLEHIKSIAKRVDAYPERYKVLKDMGQFGAMFDEWVRNIPEPVLPPEGAIKFSDLCFGGRALSTEDGKFTVVPNDASKFTWKISSGYKERMVAVLGLKSVRAVFQSGADVVEFDMVPEAGNIELPPLAERVSELNFKLPEGLSGRGTLKLDVVSELSASSKTASVEIPEWKCNVEFKSPNEILFDRLKIPAAAIAALFAALALRAFAKARAAVKVRLEVVGKPVGRARPYSMRIGRKAEFGSKAGLPFRLEGNGVPPVVGAIERTGGKSFRITPRDASVFAAGQEKALGEYRLGTTVKLVMKDGSSVLIKFR